VGQHVFGKHQHHGTWATVQGGGKGAGNVFGDAAGIVNALHPLGQWAKEAEKVHLLKGFAVAAVAGHVAHQQHHGRGILERSVHANAGVGGPWPHA
jgi:hypothetical protein